jgi:TRAP transporter TAXI family solute receptor
VSPAAPALRLGTGAAGGTFFEYGPGLASLLAAAGIAIEARATGGSNENLTLLESGALDLALVAIGPAFEAWNAAGSWASRQPIRKIRALLPMYETPFHLVALASSGIGSVRQLDGKRVGTGPAKGPPEHFFRALATETGITPTLVSDSPSELARLVVDGGIDAFFFGAGVPVAAFAAVAARAPMTVFGPDESERAALCRRFPFMAPAEVPAGTYDGQRSAVRTVALWNFVLARADLADQTAYQITKAVLADPARAAAIHPAAKATVPASAAANAVVPFHAGALRFYAEAGITLA